MNIGKTLFLTILVIGCALVVGAEEVGRTAEIIHLDGTAQVKAAGEASWREAKVGVLLSKGDILKTGPDSWAIINLDGNAETATVEVEANSELAIAELTKDDAEGSQETLLDLSLGKILIKAQKLHSEKSKFEVKTPTSVVGVRGTTFAVEVESLD